MTVCDINLIATRRAQKQRAVAILRAAVYSLIVVLVGVSLLYAKMWAATRLVESQIAVVKGELESPDLANGIERVRFLETNISDFSPRVQLLEKVHDSEQSWINILNDLTRSMPRGVWVEQMSSRHEKAEQTLTFKGAGFTQRDIGQFMLQLEELSWSQPPSLGFTQTDKGKKGSGVVVNFEVTVPLEKVIGSDLQ
jgi:Tfp pilus assembly protein PilN